MRLPCKDAMENKTKELIKLLHSISRLSVQSGELEIWFEGDANPYSIREFENGSLTRELLELIERHLLRED